MVGKSLGMTIPSRMSSEAQRPEAFYGITGALSASLWHLKIGAPSSGGRASSPAICSPRMPHPLTELV